MFSQKTLAAAILTALPLVSAFPAGVLETRAPPSNASVTNPKALEWYEASPSAGRAQLATGVKCYGGEVDAEPDIESWAQFDVLWEALEKKMPNTPEENGFIQDAINKVSTQAKVDRRLILAQIMQESGGDIHVKCTGENDINCGLLQGPKGTTSCDASDPAGAIYNMVAQGIMGTKPDGIGMVGYLNMGPGMEWTDNPAPGNLYTALRCYNSGKVDPSGNLDKIKWGTASYVNDIANRLLTGYSGGDSLKTCTGGNSTTV